MTIFWIGVRAPVNAAIVVTASTGFGLQFIAARLLPLQVFLTSKIEG